MTKSFPCIRYFCCLLVVLFGALSTPRVFAEESSGIDVIIHASVAQKDMEFKIRDREFTPTLKVLNLALTGAVGDYYITLDHETTLENGVEADPGGVIFYSRSDTNLTFGYSLFQSSSVFGGYRTGKTTATYTGSNDEFTSASQGYFLGASYSHSFNSYGSLNASLAAASLDGEISLSEPFADTSVFIVTPNPPSKIEGKANGFSFGLAWSGQVSKNTLYQISYKIHRYEFEDQVVFAGIDLSYEENFDTIAIGITHFF